MRPKKIVLVRHGESVGNVDEHLYGSVPDHQLNLTETGQKQSIAAGKILADMFVGESVHAYISHYHRTRDTFKGLLAGGLQTTTMFEEPRLREQDWGHLRSPETTEKIKEEREKYGTFHYRFPDGESGSDVYDRISGFLETLHRDFKKGEYADNTLLVTHGLTIRLFIMRWFHESVETFESWKNPKNCQIFVMERQQNDKYLLTAPMQKYDPFEDD